MFAVIAAVLCLMSVSRSAALDCENLVRHSDQLDHHHLEGRWILVAGGFKDKAHEDILKGKDSVTIDFHNSTFTQTDRYGERCRFYSQKVSLEGHRFGFKVGSFNLTGSVFHTSCPDCVVFRLDYPSATEDFYLLSRRRQLEQKELEEFNAQVECLKMRPTLMMDSTKELCPERAGSTTAAKKTEGQEA